MARAMTVVCDWMQNGIPVKGKRQTVASSVARSIHLIGLASKNQIDADDVARLSGFLESFGYGLTNQVRDEHEKSTACGSSHGVLGLRYESLCPR